MPTNRSFLEMNRMVETVDAGLSAAQHIPRLLVELEMMAHQLAAFEYDKEGAGVDHRPVPAAAEPEVAAPTATQQPVRPQPQAVRPPNGRIGGSDFDPVSSFFRGMDRPTTYKPLTFRDTPYTDWNLNETTAVAPAKVDVKAIGARLGEVAAELRQHFVAAAQAYAQSTGGGGDGGNFLNALQLALDKFAGEFRKWDRRMLRRNFAGKLGDEFQRALINADRAKNPPKIQMDDLLDNIAQFSRAVASLSPGKSTRWLKVQIGGGPGVFVDPFDGSQHMRMVNKAKRLQAYEWKIQLVGGTGVEDSMTVDITKDGDWISAVEWLKDRMRDQAVRKRAEGQSNKAGKGGTATYEPASPEDLDRSLGHLPSPVADQPAIPVYDGPTVPIKRPD